MSFFNKLKNGLNKTKTSIDDKINNYLDNIIDNNYDYLYIYYDIKKDGNTYIISLYIYKEYRNMIKRKVDVLEVTRR